MNPRPCRQDCYEGVCRLDAASAKWNTGFLQPPFGGRRYHTAVALGSDIWVVGGSDDKDVNSQVHVLDTKTLQWRAVNIRYLASRMEHKVQHCVCLLLQAQNTHHKYCLCPLSSSLLPCSGDERLLQRAAHGCVRHPTQPNALLLFGGYGLDSTTTSTSNVWLNDLVILRTDRSVNFQARGCTLGLSAQQVAVCIDRLQLAQQNRFITTREL